MKDASWKHEGSSPWLWGASVTNLFLPCSQPSVDRISDLLHTGWLHLRSNLSEARRYQCHRKGHEAVGSVSLTIRDLAISGSWYNNTNIFLLFSVWFKRFFVNLQWVRVSACTILFLGTEEIPQKFQNISKTWRALINNLIYLSNCLPNLSNLFYLLIYSLAFFSLFEQVLYLMHAIFQLIASSINYYV